MPTIIDGSASATFATPLPLSQGGTGNTSGNVVSSQVADALNATGSAPLFACRGWVNFNGTGTVAIRASGNVSSITDNGTGDYTLNFATAMEDVNYAVSGSVGGSGPGSTDSVVSIHGSAAGLPATTMTTTALRVRTGYGVTAVDYQVVSVAIFR